MSPLACEVCDSVAMLPSSWSWLSEPIGAGCQTEEGCDLRSSLASLQAVSVILWSVHSNNTDTYCTYATWPDSACSLNPESWIIAIQNSRPERKSFPLSTLLFCYSMMSFVITGHEVFIRSLLRRCVILLSLSPLSVRYQTSRIEMKGLTSVLMRARRLVPALKW